MNNAPENMPVEPPRHKTRRRAWLWVFGGCGVLAALYTGHWFFIAHHLRGGVEQWVAAQANEGMSVRYEGIASGGFPLAVRVTLAQPVITSDNKRQPFVWRGQQAVVSVKPWQPRTVRVALGGPQELGLTAQGKTTTWQGRARRLLLSFTGRVSGAGTLGVRIERLEMAAPGQQQRLHIEHGRIDFMQKKRAPVDEKTPSRTWALAASGVVVPDSLSLPLGHTFSRIVFQGSLLGEPPARFDPRALLAWRDAGGTVEIKALEVAYGALDLKTDGTLALDEQLQPVGAFTAKVQGFSDVIAALRRRNLIKPKVAFTAGLILGALAKSPGPGERPRLDVALSIQNRKLYVGPVALTKLPFIRWEAMAP